MFWWIVISAPLLLLVIILCLPFSIILSVNSQPSLVMEAKVRWALWQIKTLRFDAAAPHAATPSKKTAAPKPSSPATVKTKPTTVSHRGPSSSQTVAEERQKERLPLSGAALYRLFKKYFPRFWRALHWRCLRGDLRLVVTDPATYGWIWALLGALHWPQPPIRLQVELSHQSDFQAHASWRLRLFPIQWLGLASSIAWEPVVRPLWQGRLRKKGESKRVRPQSVLRPAGKPYIQQDRYRRSYYGG